MKQVFRINELGEYVEPVILQDGEEIPLDCVEDIPTEGLYKAKWNGTSWEEGAVIDHLVIAKKQKLSELDSKCKESILGYFKATIDGVEYSFSNDAEAQSNFKDGMWALENNKVTTIKWTAYDSTGNIVRLDLDLIKLSDVNVTRLTHQQTMVAKYRDILQPQIELSATVEEVNNITWG
jgi:hypothetical protein